MKDEVQGVIDVDALANEIRRVDGNHDLGAGALAEALIPYLTAALRQQQDGVQCCMCVKRVDTRENGTPGAELTDGRWACSEECWERATASTAGREAVACYGIRRKGTQAIIGVVPEKVHAIPLDPERSAPYMRDYEEVPLYTHPSPAIGSELEAIKREWHAAKLKHPLGEEERVRNSMIDDFLGDLDRILPSTGSGDERNTPREAGSA